MLTREHRLAVIREFWSFNYDHEGFPDGYTAIDAFERAVKEGGES